MMQEFNISNNWAYETIRVIVKAHPELHLQKIDALKADGSFDHTGHELVWIETRWYSLNALNWERVEFTPVISVTVVIGFQIKEVVILLSLLKIVDAQMLHFGLIL